MIATFYSFKGGVGRSMALANVGEILADWGYRVIVCDWDLEAPGLERYFAESGETAGALAEKPGIIDLLLEYKQSFGQIVDDEEPNGSGMGHVGDTHAQFGKLRIRKPTSYAIPDVPFRNSSRSGSLRLLTAGRRGAFATRYTEAIRNLNWSEFYSAWAGDAYLEFFREELRSEADIVLIDSRTGVTEQGGVCTHHLADLVVLLTGTNEQNLDGTAWMRRVLSSKRMAQLRDGRTIGVLPVAARVEITAENDKLLQFRREFAREFARAVPPSVSDQAFLLNSEIPYIPYYSFREHVVARDPDHERRVDLYNAYWRIAKAVVEHGIASELLRAIPIPTLEDSAVPLSSGVLDHPDLKGGSFVLSHGPDQREIAEKIVKGLGTLGVRIWSPSTAIQRGDSWLRQFHEAVDRSQGAILLIGPGPQLEWLEAELDYLVRRSAALDGFRIVPVFVGDGSQPQLPSLIAHLDPIRLPREIGRERYRILAAELIAKRGTVAGLLADPPFPGGAAYDESSSRFFFSRDQETFELVDRLAQRAGGRALLIDGATGVGKSSLVRAGLIPTLRRTGLPDPARCWNIVVMHPGMDPLESLIEKLRGSTKGTLDLSGAEQLQVDPGALNRAIWKYCGDTHGLVLICDPLQVPPATGGADRRAWMTFDAAMACCIEDLHLSFRFVGVAGNLPSLDSASLPELSRALENHGSRYHLDPLTHGRLKDALLGAATLAGGSWEKGLVDRLVDDLPKTELSVALANGVAAALWSSCSDGQLTHTAYAKGGGVGGALARHADQVLQWLDGEEKQRTCSLLLSLVQMDAPFATSGRVIPSAEALDAAGGGEAAAATLKWLSDARLVVVASTGFVQIAHPALAEESAQLREWIENSKDLLERREELEAAARSWDAASRPAELVPAKRRRVRYDGLRGLSDVARDYIAAGKQMENQRRWYTLALVAASTVILVVLAILFVSLVRQRDQARRIVAERQRADSLANDLRLSQLRRDTLYRRADSLTIQAVQANQRASVAGAVIDSLLTDLRARQQSVEEQAAVSSGLREQIRVMQAAKDRAEAARSAAVDALAAERSAGELRDISLIALRDSLRRARGSLTATQQERNELRVANERTQSEVTRLRSQLSEAQTQIEELTETGRRWQNRAEANAAEADSLRRQLRQMRAGDSAQAQR